MNNTQARNTSRGDNADMTTTTIDYTQRIAAICGDFPEQAVTLTCTSDEVVLTCDGTAVRGRISRSDTSPKIHITPELRAAIFGESSPLSDVSRGMVMHGILERADRIFDPK